MRSPTICRLCRLSIEKAGQRMAKRRKAAPIPASLNEHRKTVIA